MRNTEILQSVCVWCDIYSSSCIDWGSTPYPQHTNPHHKMYPRHSAGWCIWRRKSRRSAVKSKSDQRGRVRNSAALSCSQDLAVSHEEPLTAHHHRPSDHMTGQMRRLHQIINTLTGGRRTCPRRNALSLSPIANISPLGSAPAQVPPSPWLRSVSIATLEGLQHSHSPSGRSGESSITRRERPANSWSVCESFYIVWGEPCEQETADEEAPVCRIHCVSVFALPVRKRSKGAVNVSRQLLLSVFTELIIHMQRTPSGE